RTKYASAPAAAANGEVTAAKASTPDVIEAKSTSSQRRAVSPVARKLAAELGVNLDRVTGSGPGGRITREDVERAAKSPPASTAAVPSSAAPRQSIPMRGMRKTIAERMHQSLRDTAQLTITSEADVTPATELRERLKREFDFTYTDLLIQAA